MKPLYLGVAFLLSGVIAISSTLAMGQPNDGSTRSPATAKRDEPLTAKGPYYVEFRAATIGTYGHSYAVYGSVTGKPNYVDLHPMGNYAVMAVGHLLPV